MEQKSPSTYLSLTSGHDSWSSSTRTATVSSNYPVNKPNHDAAQYDPQKDIWVSGGFSSVAAAPYSHAPCSSSVQHGYNPEVYENYYYYSYPQAANYSSVQQGANQYPGASYQPHTSFQSSGSYIGHTSNTYYNYGDQQTVPRYESNSYHYLNSIQQGANQYLGAAYQPLRPFQNSGPYIGSTSNTYYTPGGNQTVPGYGRNRYYYRNNAWNDGRSRNNCARSYHNSSSDNNALQGSTSVHASSLPYQQQYNQWPYYYNHSLPIASSNPVAGNSTTDNIAGNTPWGYSCPSSETPPPGTTSWRINSAASVAPPMQASNLNTCSIENLPEPLLADIIRRVTRTSDLNSLSLVSKQMYAVEAEERGTIRVGCGLHPATQAMSSLCSRFPNLWKVEINYSGWSSSQGKQLDNQGLHVLSSHCSWLMDLTLSFCSYIDDSGLGYLAYCKKLMALRLSSAPAISSRGLLLVAVGCKSLSTFHLADCMNVSSVETVLAQHEYKRRGAWPHEREPENLELGCPGNTGVEWLEYLGEAGSLVELVVKDCMGISQYDLLKFGPGWVKLQKFEFEINGNYWLSGAHDPSYNSRYTYKYDICCENMKDLRLAKIITEPEIGLRFLLGKCKALEKLCLDYVVGLDESEMIALFQNCSNLRSISLRFEPRRGNYFQFRTPLTDDSLKALSVYCPMLEVVEFTFTFCSSSWPTEIGFTQEGIIMLIQSCPIRSVMLNGANIFYDEGMKALSSAQLLERLELVDCKRITDAGISFITRAPCLTSLTLRKCRNVTDAGMAELARSQKLESLTVIGCRLVSEEAVQGAAKSVHYSAELESFDSLKGMNIQKRSSLCL